MCFSSLTFKMIVVQKQGKFDCSHKKIYTWGVKCTLKIQNYFGAKHAGIKQTDKDFKSIKQCLLNLISILKSVII